jgi:hypothetical protein
MKAMDENQPNMVFMKGGKMMVLWRGETRLLDLVMTLDNGARVDMDGTVTLPDGSSRTLLDGEALTMDGEPTTVVDAHARDKLGK